ncbi:MAG TPA: ATP-binding protein [Castellaniella sp.]|uniref:sensor histidine kinase n=1 Tax=Castellaniella sp. TaxID=1955812 RepID=UPI002EDF4AC3
MDGLKSRLKTSVQYRLSFTLSSVLIFVAVVAGVFSFLSVFDEAHDLQDDVLRQIATLIDQQRLSWQPTATGPRIENADDDSTVYVQVLGASGLFAGKTRNNQALPLPADLVDGLQTLNLGGESYRVLVKMMRSGARVAVSQETDARNEMATNSALRTLLPFLVLVPVLLMLIARLIRTMFRPITGLSRQLDARSDDDLRPIRADHLPSEVRPFVLAINRLLARVAESIKSQQRFVADAAHELRSPLTALSLQAQRMDHLQMSEAARTRLAILQKGIERGRNLLNQLLSLSKVQAGSGTSAHQISVSSVYRTVLEDLMPLARAKHIDLGVLEGPDAALRASELDLCTLVKNLVDNAILYTPDYGRVDLSVGVTHDAVVLQVADTGPGIAEAERARVFDPFYRVLGSDQPGSGLGLAIVKAIGDRLGARLELSDTDAVARTGLTVRVIVPVASPQVPSV